MSTTVAIVGADVVPMDSERVLQDQTVVIADGRISAMGPTAEVPVLGCEVVDGVGRYLLPGLADMHVHLWNFGGAARYLGYGVTTVRNMWGDPVHLAYVKRFDRGEVVGPRMITVSPGLDGRGPDGGPVWDGGRCVDDPSQADPLVRDFARRGYTQIKAYSWLQPAVLSALGEASASAGLRLVGHCPDAMSFENAIDAGMSCFEHLYNIQTGHQVKDSEPAAVDLEAIRRLAGRMAEQGVWNCPTQLVVQARVGGNDDQPITDDAFTEIVRILHEEGAPLLAGSDNPNRGLTPGPSLLEELVNLENAGLRPFEALRCTTADAARFLDTDHWGTIAVGKAADLVLVNSNPLHGVAALGDMEVVVAAGRLLRRPDLDKLRADDSPVLRASAIHQTP